MNENLTHKTVLDGRNFEVRIARNFQTIDVYCIQRPRNSGAGLTSDVFGKAVANLMLISGAKKDRIEYQDCIIKFPMPQEDPASLMSKISEALQGHTVTVDSDIPLE